MNVADFCRRGKNVSRETLVTRPFSPATQTGAPRSARSHTRAHATTAKYVALARDHGLDPAQMANTFVNIQPFTTANIIGARTMDQLDSAIATGDMTLSDDLIEGIESIHKETPIGY